MSTIFLKTETAANLAWATVCEGMNSFYEESDPGFTPKYEPIQDQEQRINAFVKIQSKVRVYKDDSGNLSIGVTAPVPGQTLGTKSIDMDVVKESLGSCEALYFGYNFTEEAASQSDTISKSTFFGRNSLDNRMYDFVNGEYLPDGEVNSAVWMVFYKIKDTDIYYCILNNNLVELNQSIDFSNDTDSFYALTTFDGSFKNCVFKPSVTDAQFVGSNIIATSSDTFTLDMFGWSKIHMVAGTKTLIPDSKLPDFDLQVQSSTTFTQNKNKIEVDMTDKQVATLSYRWITGTDLDFLQPESETLRYDFVVIKV